MSQRVAIFILSGGIAVASVLYGLFLNIPANDVVLYLQCQNIKTGYLRVTLLDDNEPFYQQDFQLETSCDQTGMRIVKRAHTSWLNVVLRLYSADGSLLSTKKGSRQQDDILLDENGFHVDLNLNGKPPNITFHTL